MSSTQEIVNSLLENEYKNFVDGVHSLLIQKVNERIDQEKLSVASVMFEEESEDDDSDEDTEMEDEGGTKEKDDDSDEDDDDDDEDESDDDDKDDDD